MPNEFLTSTLISKECVAILKADSDFGKIAYTGYEGMYSQDAYKPGETIKIRLNNYFEGSRGWDTSSSNEDIVEASQDLTIRSPYNVKVQYRADKTYRDIADFGDEVLRPAMENITAQINKDIVLVAKTGLSNVVGDASATLNSYASASVVKPRFVRMHIPASYGRYVCVDPDNANTLRNSLQNSFVEPLNKDITYDAQMGRLFGFDFMEQDAIATHTSGTHTAAGDITVDTAVATGSTLVVTGLTQGATFNVGDDLTIAGIKDYDQIYRKAQNWDKNFVVTAVSGPADANGDITLTIFPALVATGPRQNYVAVDLTTGVPLGTNEIPANRVVTPVTGTYVNNLALSGRGLLMAMPPMAKLRRNIEADDYTDPATGFTMMVSQWSDGDTMTNNLRISAIAAIGFVDYQGVRLLSKVA